MAASFESDANLDLSQATDLKRCVAPLADRSSGNQVRYDESGQGLRQSSWQRRKNRLRREAVREAAKSTQSFIERIPFLTSGEAKKSFQETLESTLHQILLRLGDIEASLRSTAYGTCADWDGYAVRGAEWSATNVWEQLTPAICLPPRIQQSTTNSKLSADAPAFSPTSTIHDGTSLGRDVLLSCRPVAAAMAKPLELHNFNLVDKSNLITFRSGPERAQYQEPPSAVWSRMPSVGTWLFHSCVDCLVRPQVQSRTEFIVHESSDLFRNQSFDWHMFRQCPTWYWQSLYENFNNRGLRSDDFSNSDTSESDGVTVEWPDDDADLDTVRTWRMIPHPLRLTPNDIGELAYKDLHNVIVRKVAGGMSGESSIDRLVVVAVMASQILYESWERRSLGSVPRTKQSMDAIVDLLAEDVRRAMGRLSDNAVRALAVNIQALV